jgi:hypothetical protein
VQYNTTLSAYTNLTIILHTFHHHLLQTTRRRLRATNPSGRVHRLSAHANFTIILLTTNVTLQTTRRRRRAASPSGRVRRVAKNVVAPRAAARKSGARDSPPARCRRTANSDVGSATALSCHVHVFFLFPYVVRLLLSRSYVVFFLCCSVDSATALSCHVYVFFFLLM